MEYIFGTIKRKGRVVDILKTVGEEHTNLTDNHTIVREYSDSTITDTFTVAEHYLSKDGEDGKKYDWYELANHYRYIDYFTPQKDALVEELSPYTDSKTAYIDDSEVTFTDVPNGNLSVFVVGDDYPNYYVGRENGRITVSFTEPLEYVAEVTIQVS